MRACHMPLLPRCSLLLGMALLAAAFLAGPAGARWIDLGGDPLSVSLVESDGERSVIEITLGGFEALPVPIDGEDYYRILLEGASVQEVLGFPALPDARRSLIIPDDQEMSVTLLSGDYVDLPGMPVIPSKGHLPRSIDPATVPYSFDSFYESEASYPAGAVEAHDPYILRDFRGMVVDMNVFQYTPATKTLRVYTRMLVEVAPVGPGSVNVLNRNQSLEKMDTQFAKLYENHFLNFSGGRYTPVLEDGGLLIITYDAFLPNIEPLYEWKMQRGLPSKLVTLSETGSTSTQIKDYIQNEYDQGWLAYVLLIGDAAQLPTVGGMSDPGYSLLAGGDSYPDIFVGRFSAENPDHVDTQVERTIHYERDLGAGLVWPQYGTGIASSGGPGHHGELDWEHSDLMRDDLLAYGYYEVDRIYDILGATAQMVTDALHEGRGIVNYTGHGSTTAWGTTGFSNSHVNALQNDNMLPFICSVACYNGNFTGSTCFGEAWMRATHDGVPTGAIACYMSKIGQSWNPPMDSQDESVDLLVADSMRTIGGLWFNGSCLMIDINGAAGASEFENWTIFGDPSLPVRTKTPELMAVSHNGTLILGESQYAVSVPGVAEALCALYADGILYGSALTDAVGSAIIDLDPAPAEPMTLALTVTAYNKVTYIGDVEVIPAEGPYLLIGEVLYEDSGGDGLVNAGESVDMRVKLRNVGIETATNVSAVISVEDEYITLVTDTQTYPDIPPGGEAWSQGPYAFDVSPDCPDQHPVIMPMVIEGQERITWETEISFLVHAPAISIIAIEIDDTVGGNGNFRLDPGEDATVAITLLNSGSGSLDDITGIFTCDHPLITVSAGTGTIAGLGQGESGLLEPIFEVSVDLNFPAYQADFDLQVTGTNSYERTFEITLPIGGFYETVEEGAGDWVHYIVTAGFVDEWHISDTRNHTPGGSHSWKCGDTGSGLYANLLDAGLETPAVSLAGDAALIFWMWIAAEESGAYPGRAYDGGLVEMSVDGGAFEQITPVGGYTHTIREGSIPGPFPVNTPVFSGSFDWQPVRFDLPDAEGHVVFRFRFGSDGADQREGWYIDDIEILGLTSPEAVDGGDLGPVRMSLAPSRPNPFAGSTSISFAMPQAGQARLEVFDPSGRLVRTLLSAAVPAGSHVVVWEGADEAGRPVASGLYYYRLSTAESTMNRSIVLLR